MAEAECSGGGGGLAEAAAAMTAIRNSGAQFNSFVEISTDFSTEFPVLQDVQHYYKNSVEKSVEIYKAIELTSRPPTR